MNNDKDFLESLLNESESELIDFKREKHSTRAELVHDILCLANSASDESRFIIFGIDDVNKSIVGLNDETKPRLHDIIDQLKASHLNHIPKVSIEEKIIEGNTLCFLKIFADERRPFYLLRPISDKKINKDSNTNISKDRNLSAGSIYTRIGDTNIARDSTAPDLEVERLWKIRLGLTLPPHARFEKLIASTASWKSVVSNVYFHENFPEFTIKTEEDSREDFAEEWCESTFPSTHCYRYIASCLYYGTVLRQVYVIWLDGMRYLVPQPEIHLNPDFKRWFYWVKDSFNIKLAQVMHSGFSLYFTQILRTTGVPFLDESPPKEATVLPTSDSAQRRYT